MDVSEIIVGKSGNRNVSINVDILLSTRMLVTADSGGGKTFLLKRIIEQALGKIQIITIDPEGEFSPLREKFPFVLVGKGGETPADVRSARLVAQTLMKLRANAVCDLYEMKPSSRHEWVRDFCDGLLEAPKEHRHPCLVIVDEAHLFAPEHGKGESVASDAVIGLCTRGRKRLLVPLFATQRLATLSKDASSMLLNRMVGGTFEDVNRKRAAEVLGIEKNALQSFYDEIKTLEPGYFFALGRAISKERILLHVGPIQTAHGQDALKYEITPPPPPEAIAKLLPKLSELPRQAEEKAKTEAEYKTQIRQLKAEVATLQRKATPVVAVSSPSAHTDGGDMKRMKEKCDKEIAAIHADRMMLFAKGAKIAQAITALAAAAQKDFRKREFKQPNIDLPKAFTEVPKGAPVFVNSPPLPQAVTENNGDLPGPQRRILSALSELRSIGKVSAPREMVAGWSGYSPTSGGFNNPLGNLNVNGFVSYPSAGMVSLTDKGLHVIGELPPPDQTEVRRRIENVCDGPQRKILSVLFECGEEEISRAELAQRAGYSETSGGFNNPLGNLRTKGFIDYPRTGYVRAASWLFQE